jgi:hypothetical protein
VNKIHPFLFLLAQKWFVMRSTLVPQINAAFRCGPGRAPLAPTTPVSCCAQSQHPLCSIYARSTPQAPVMHRRRARHLCPAAKCRSAAVQAQPARTRMDCAVTVIVTVHIYFTLSSRHGNHHDDSRKQQQCQCD